MGLLALPLDVQRFLGTLTDSMQVRFFSERRLRRLLRIKDPSSQHPTWNRILRQFEIQKLI